MSTRMLESRRHDAAVTPRYSIKAYRHPQFRPSSRTVASKSRRSLSRRCTLQVLRVTTCDQAQRPGMMVLISLLLVKQCE
jgi:hypothetical protein